MAIKTTGGSQRNNRGLRIEQLESRSLLTVASFGVNLYTDLGGAPGQLITDNTVHIGDTFFVEITAEDVREGDVPFGLRGLHGIALDIAWDEDLLTSRNDPFVPSEVLSDKLPAFQYGVLDNVNGTIDDLSGSAGLSENLIGGSGPEQYALLRFEAQSAGSSFFWFNLGRSNIAFYPSIHTTRWDFDFGTEYITVLPAGQAETIPPVDPPAEPVAPTPPSDVETAGDLNQVIQAATAPLPVTLGTAVDVPQVPMHLCEVASTLATVPAPLVSTTIEALPADESAAADLEMKSIHTKSFDDAASGIALSLEAAHVSDKQAEDQDKAAVDVVFATTSTQELLAGTKQVHVDSALIQALAFALASAKDPADTVEQFGRF